jgi:hypothetical protein
MASFQKFHCFVENRNEGVHNLASHTLKLLLTNSAPSASNTIKANLTEISAGNGYTAGGATVDVTSSSQTSGTYKLIASDEVITASGGSIGPFRYAVLYNDTPTSPADPLIGWWDYGTNITLAAGESLTIDFSATDGILQDS